MGEPVSIDRILINIVSDDLPVAAAFYEKLLGFERIYDSDWFVNLKHPDSEVEIGIIKRGHEIVPQGASGKPGGMYLTFVVTNVEVAVTQAKLLGSQVVEEPTDTSYGQRRMLLLDPDGNTLDISSLQGSM